MDEQRLNELFHAATGDAPPAGFDHTDVVGASRRLSERRHRIAAGVTVSVLAAALSGGLVTGVLAGSQPSRDSSSLAETPASAPEVQSDTLSGRAAAPAAPPPAIGPRGCMSDPTLAAAAMAALPGSGDRGVTALQTSCPPSARGVEVALPDGSLRVVLDPYDSTTALPPGARSRTVRTASGQSATVSAIPTQAGPGPDDATLSRVADAVANQF